jgi:hypothetical protein
MSFEILQKKKYDKGKMSTKGISFFFAVVHCQFNTKQNKQKSSVKISQFDGREGRLGLNSNK